MARKRRRRKRPTNLKKLDQDLKITKKHCQGRIQQDKVKYNNPNLGNVHDLYCVVKGYKPIAIFDVSNLALSEYRKTVKELVNNILKEAKNRGIQAIVAPVPGTPARFATFFPKKERRRAELAHYLATTKRGMALRNDYLYGRLLGYSPKNIQYYYHKNSNLNKYNQDRQNAKELVKLIIKSNHYKNFIKHLKPFYFKPLK